MKAVQWSFQRVEKKYLMTKEQFEQLMTALEPHVVPDDYPVSTICNIYYDTPDYLLIQRSIEKPNYKEKFRLRSYGVPEPDSPIFMEIKKKYNGIVYKRRVRTTAAEAQRYLAGGPVPSCNDKQIMKEIHWFCRRYPLQPGMFLAYDRWAYRGREDKNLRITFDRNIRYRIDDLDLTHGDYGTRLLPEDNVLMEIKIPGAAPLWLAHILSELGIFSNSFSKYGRCYQRVFEELRRRRNYTIRTEVDQSA